MHCHWAVLTKLFFRFLNVADEFNKPFTGSRYALFWPVGELKLADGT